MTVQDCRFQVHVIVLQQIFPAWGCGLQNLSVQVWRRPIYDRRDLGFVCLGCFLFGTDFMPRVNGLQ